MVNVYLDYILADKTKAITDEDSFAKTTNDPIINEVIQVYKSQLSSIKVQVFHEDLDVTDSKNGETNLQTSQLLDQKTRINKSDDPFLHPSVPEIPPSLNPHIQHFLKKVYTELSQIHSNAHELFSTQLDSAHKTYVGLKNEMDTIHESLARRKTLLQHIGLKDQERNTYKSQIEDMQTKLAEQ